MRKLFYIILILTAVCCWIAIAQAQKSSDVLVGDGLPAATATWIDKIAKSIEGKAGVELTAPETRALVDHISLIEQRQAADIAVSDTMVYVLSQSGTVLLSKELP